MILFMCETWKMDHMVLVATCVESVSYTEQSIVKVTCLDSNVSPFVTIINAIPSSELILLHEFLKNIRAQDYKEKLDSKQISKGTC